MINKKARLSLILVAIFVVPFVLSACGSTDNNPNQKNNEGYQERNGATDMQIETKEELRPADKIEFSDPGNDEIGKEIKEMDDLLNQTSPSEYSEDDLSDNVIENDIELK